LQLAKKAATCRHAHSASCLHNHPSQEVYSNLAQDEAGAGALLHAMLPQLASLAIDKVCRPEASATILSGLAQAAGGVLPLHTLRLDWVSLSAIAPIVGSLRKPSLGYIYDPDNPIYDPDDGAKRAFASLLAHAHQLQELELLGLQMRLGVTQLAKAVHEG